MPARLCYAQVLRNNSARSPAKSLRSGYSQTAAHRRRSRPCTGTSGCFSLQPPESDLSARERLRAYSCTLRLVEFVNRAAEQPALLGSVAGSCSPCMRTSMPVGL